jgi:hypothetical protein
MSAWGKADTVLGLWLDPDSGAFRVTTNGDFTPPNGGTVVASGLVPGEGVGSGIYPAVSGRDCAIRVNLGQDPFSFQPPGYQDVWAAASAVKVQVTFLVHWDPGYNTLRPFIPQTKPYHASI